MLMKILILTVRVWVTCHELLRSSASPLILYIVVVPGRHLVTVIILIIVWSRSALMITSGIPSLVGFPGSHIFDGLLKILQGFVKFKHLILQGILPFNSYLGLLLLVSLLSVFVICRQ